MFRGKLEMRVRNGWAQTHICSEQGAYMGRPKVAYRSNGLYAAGGKILYGGESLCHSRKVLLFDYGMNPTCHTGSS